MFLSFIFLVNKSSNMKPNIYSLLIKRYINGTKLPLVSSNSTGVHSVQEPKVTQSCKWPSCQTDGNGLAAATENIKYLSTNISIYLR